MPRDDDIRGGIDLWEMVQSDPELMNASATEGADTSTLLIAGDSGSGKSSLVQMFLKPNSNKDPKKTFALEYNFARRKNAGAGAKSLAHIWELGGDMKEPGLLDIPLTAQNLSSASVMIVVDLSQPQNVLTSLQRWIQVIREHIQTKIGELKALDSDLAASMKSQAKKRYSEDHEDASRVRPCEVPITVVGNKFDQFRSRPIAERRALFQAIRFMAHYHGASFIATSRIESSYRDSFRSVMSSVAFSAPMKSVRQVTGDKPPLISAGMDTFHSILLAVGTGKTPDESCNSQFAASDSDLEFFVGASGIRKDCWERFHEVLSSMFGAADASAGGSAVPASETSGAADAEKDTLSNEYPEADIDEARAAMDMKLEQYMLDVERRERLNASNELKVESRTGPVASEVDDVTTATRK